MLREWKASSCEVDPANSPPGASTRAASRTAAPAARVLEHLLAEHEVEAHVGERQPLAVVGHELASLRVRAATSGESAMSAPTHSTPGSSERNRSTESPAPQPRSSTRRAGSR